MVDLIWSPPGAWDFETMLHDVTVSAFDFAAGGAPAAFAVGGVGNGIGVAIEVICLAP
jgi:hypothetical protein